MNRALHRVTVRRSHGVFHATCPACIAREPWGNLPDANLAAEHHARGCEPLMALNRVVLHACTNCNGTGEVGGDECVCCLGRGVA